MNAYLWGIVLLSGDSCGETCHSGQPFSIKWLRFLGWPYMHSTQRVGEFHLAD